VAQEQRPEGAEKPGSTYQVTLDPYVPEGTPILYTDGLAVVTGNGVWTLSFLQAEPPINPSDRPERIPSRCVVRLIVTEERMVQFLKVLVGTGEKTGLIVNVTPEQLAELEAQEAADV
jgi:hypothetical protein